MGIRRGVAAALNALSLVSVTTFAQDAWLMCSRRRCVFCALKPSGMALVACPEEDIPKWPPIMEGYDWAPFFNSLGVTYAVLDYTPPPDGDRSRPLTDVG